ncbi:hypothetical protein PHYBOEH_008825 [Phytophthora boehmeriae]|uniref:Kazal-like domain-containing protein n=1 Tax=Phytophthora boehmeriae TaxID=109152 RepID=A0A8T1X5X4_9STRA|nr:hypothetical protein PHYBOEH_008825 [Phytophthora boehmeriae]
MKPTAYLLIALIAAAIATAQAESFGFPTIDAKNQLTPAVVTTTFCPGSCRNYFASVTDKNGVKYSNECHMRMAKCKKESADASNIESGSAFAAPKLVKGTEAPEGVQESTSSSGSTSSTDSSLLSSGKCSFVCPAVFQPVTDENGNTYSNACKMKAAKCKESKLKPVGANGEESKPLGLSTKAPTSRLFCPTVCPKNISPVFDENGVMYPNRCHMTIAKCQGKNK